MEVEIGRVIIHHWKPTLHVFLYMCLCSMHRTTLNSELWIIHRFFMYIIMTFILSFTWFYCLIQEYSCLVVLALLIWTFILDVMRMLINSLWSFVAPFSNINSISMKLGMVVYLILLFHQYHCTVQYNCSTVHFMQEDKKCHTS